MTEHIISWGLDAPTKFAPTLYVGSKDGQSFLGLKAAGDSWRRDFNTTARVRNIVYSCARTQIWFSFGQEICYGAIAVSSLHLSLLAIYMQYPGTSDVPLRTGTYCCSSSRV